MSSPMRNIRALLTSSVVMLAGGVLVAGPADAAGSGGILPATSPTTPSITDIAGTGSRGLSGDGGVAVEARLANPIGLAEDAAGNLYIADSANDRIRKVVDPTVVNSDVITTVAGQRRRGFSGDDGPATMARLDDPTGIAVDSQGDLFVADTANNRVREIGAGGTINTIAGNGRCGYRTPLGNNGAATDASLCAPTGIAVDAKGDVFIADSGHNAVREVKPDGTITTMAGTGVRGFAGNGGPARYAELDDPLGLAVDALGNVYVADTANNEVRVVNARGIIEDFAGNARTGSGKGRDLRIEHRGPRIDGRGFGRDGRGVDGGNQGLGAGNRRFEAASKGRPSGRPGSGDGPAQPRGAVTFEGLVSHPTDPHGPLGDGGPAVRAHLSSPTGLSVDPSGNVFIADTGDNRVREVSGGTISTYAGNGRFGRRGNGGPATSAEFRSPTGIVTDGAAVYLADTGNNEIRGVFTGPPPVLPETPLLIALPGAAILIGGAGYLFLRRRRAAVAS